MNITSVHMFSVVFMLSWFLCAKPAFAGSKGDCKGGETMRVKVRSV